MITRSIATDLTDSAQPAADDRHVYWCELSGFPDGNWHLYADGTLVDSTTGPLTPDEAQAWANETLGQPVPWAIGPMDPDAAQGKWVADRPVDASESLGWRPVLLLAVLGAIATGVALVLHAVGPATSGPAGFAAVFAALSAAHLVGDYWVQTDHQACRKGDVLTGALTGPHRLSWKQRWHGSAAGWAANLGHVATYTATAAAAVALVAWRTGLTLHWGHVVAGLAVSAVTHAWADRRHTLAWLARLAGGGRFYATRDGGMNGAHLLDQSWHVGWLLIAALIAS